MARVNSSTQSNKICGWHIREKAVPGEDSTCCVRNFRQNSTRWRHEIGLPIASSEEPNNPAGKRAESKITSDTNACVRVSTKYSKMPLTCSWNSNSYRGSHHKLCEKPSSRLCTVETDEEKLSMTCSREQTPMEKKKAESRNTNATKKCT